MRIFIFITGLIFINFCNAQKVKHINVDPFTNGHCYFSMQVDTADKKYQCHALDYESAFLLEVIEPKFSMKLVDLTSDSLMEKLSKDRTIKIQISEKYRKIIIQDEDIPFVDNALPAFSICIVDIPEKYMVFKWSDLTQNKILVEKEFLESESSLVKRYFNRSDRIPQRDNFVFSHGYWLKLKVLSTHPFLW